jgi:hypothetical protein
VAQAALELLDSDDPLASASQSSWDYKYTQLSWGVGLHCPMASDAEPPFCVYLQLAHLR